MIQLISNTLNKTLLKLLTQTPETFCFHSSISVTISSAWYGSCGTKFNLKIKKNSILSDSFILIM